MGMYTEIIFGCELKKDTPEVVVNVLRYMCGEIEKPSELPEHEFFEEDNRDYLFKSASYYFGTSKPNQHIWFDKISNSWKISARGNIKNYGNEIEKFLDWIKPYIDSGSGYRDFYAIVCYEEQSEPDIYYLHPEDR